jgi:Ca2+-transporting ATPase
MANNEKKQVKKSWHTMKAKEVLEHFDSQKSGLSSAEAEKRLEKHGSNKLVEEKPLPEFKLFISQFKSVLIYILLAAAVISAILIEWVDFGVILAAVLVNVIVGYIQESKAQKALFELKRYLKLKAYVFRDGNKIEVENQELVPGDIIYLEAGDQVPADARLIEISELQTQEAILTGESEPILKQTEPLEKKDLVTGDKTNMVFKGTMVSQGTGLAVVVNTGMSTAVGKIAKRLHETEEEKTPFQIQLQKFGRKVGIALLIVVGLVFIFGLIVDRSFTEIFLISVASAVSAIPEGLPVAVTVILAIGMQRILKKNSLVRKLIAAETLGSTSVICADKTGTITTGVMELKKISTMSRDLDLNKKELKKEEDLLFLSGILCNNATITNPKKPPKDWEIIGSPTEKSIYHGAIAQGFDVLDVKEKYSRISEIPFVAKYRRMFTMNEFNDEKNYVFCKGAPEEILKICSHFQKDNEKIELDQGAKKDLIEKFQKYSSQGYRLLAAAYKFQKKDKQEIEKNNDFIFLGFFIIRDPLRDDVKKVIKKIRKAGIRIVMITGDHVLTARSIAKDMGLKVSDDRIITGEQLKNLSDSDLKKAIKKVSVFARVSPEDKIKIVEAFQKEDEVVAMTGDGVNDAPALKTADVGIAVGAGSEITKRTADLILLDNKLKTIVDAIKEGRVIYKNIKKVIVYLLADSFTEIVLVLGSLIAGLPLPLTAAQILWINLISDSLPAASLTLEKAEKGIMKEEPRERKIKLLDKEMISIIFIIGILTDILLFGLFYWLYQGQHIDIHHIRTFIFLALGIDSLFYIFSCRSLKHSIFKIKPWTNKWLLGAVALGLVLTIAPVYIPFTRDLFNFTPLNLMDFGLLAAIAFVTVAGIEITKYIFVGRKHKKR